MKKVDRVGALLLAMVFFCGCTQQPPSSSTASDISTGSTITTIAQPSVSSEEEYIVKPLSVQNGVIPLDNEHIRPLGRTYVKDGWWYMSQNNAGFEMQMEGTSLKMEAKLNDDVTSALYPLIKVFVDSKEEDTLQLTDGNATYTLFENLPAGRHIVKVIKISESAMGSLAIRNLTMNTDGTLYTPPQKKTRRIEFIGDSITTAYGNMGTPKDTAYVSRDEDSSQGYAALVAAHYNAEERIVAAAGRGLVKNNTGDTNLLPVKLFEEYDVWNSAAYAHAEWIPQVVVINLGTNDGSARVPQEEFLAAGKRFIQNIRSKYADAQIIWAYGVMGKEYEATIRTMVQQLNDGGNAKMHCLFFDAMAESERGALGHPNVAGHQTMAKKLIADMDTYVQW